MWGAMQWMDATAKLMKKNLGRAPTENEVRAELGYPLVVGRTSAPFCLTLGIMAQANVSIPGTRFEIVFTKGEKDAVIVTLMERAEKPPAEPACPTA